MDKDIYIQKLVVHILDNTLGLPVLSEALPPLSAETNTFVGKRIERLFADGKLKSSHFMEGDQTVKELCLELRHDDEAFLHVTQELAKKLYEIMLKYLEIPSADLICALTLIGEERYLVLLKMNYKTSFIHYLDNLEGQQINTIIQQRTTLPAASQKIEEAVAISLEDLSIRLIETKVDLEDEKGFYLSPFFLNCTVDVSGQEKLKVLEKTANKVIDHYFGEEELEKRFEFKNAINNHLEDAQEIKVEEIAQAVFGQIPQIKETYLEEVAHKGIEEDVIAINHQQNEEYYKQQRLVTDTGIEIKVPVSEYDNKDKIEFITNPDGTISILIKNIKTIRK